MKDRIYLSPPHMGGEELKFIQQAFDTNWIAPAGPHLDAFELELARYNQVSHCAAVSSGTAAIHLALIILGVSRGDEVICSTFTFSGSCNPVSYVGATPVFVDSENKTWNMDPDLLEEAIKDRISRDKKPKAIIVVHLYGMPAQMNEIMSLARQYDIPVIEDAAEALGATYFGKKTGTFGDIGIYSFNGNKIITTSGGGALVAENKEWVARAKFLATQAREPKPYYEHKEIGYNYRLSNINAGIGLGQMKVLDQRVAQRRNNFDTYRMKLTAHPHITFLSEPEGFVSNRWLTTVLIDQHHSTESICEKVRLALDAEHIESRPLWKPMHMQPVFKDAPIYGGKVSEALFRTGLCLPSGSNLTQEEIWRVLKIVEDSM